MSSGATSFDRWLANLCQRMKDASVDKPLSLSQDAETDTCHCTAQHLQMTVGHLLLSTGALRQCHRAAVADFCRLLYQMWSHASQPGFQARQHCGIPAGDPFHTCRIPMTLNQPRGTGVCGQGMSNVFAAPPIKYCVIFFRLSIPNPNRNPNLKP